MKKPFPTYKVASVLCVMVYVVFVFVVIAIQTATLQEYKEQVNRCQKDMRDLTIEYDARFKKLTGENQKLTEENEILNSRLVDSAGEVEYYVQLLDSKVPGEYIRVSRKDLVLLSKVVQLEAGYPDKHKAGQQYITKVILNRVLSPDFPNTVSEVLYQNGQFSTVWSVDSCDLQLDTVLNVYEVLNGMAAQDLPGYVTFFYSDKVKSGWLRTLPVWMTYDGTVYAYTKRSEQYDAA